MTDCMTNTSDRIEIITSVQRRRRWTAAEKMRLVEQTFAPGMTVSLVARLRSRSAHPGRPAASR